MNAIVVNRLFLGDVRCDDDPCRLLVIGALRLRDQEFDAAAGNFRRRHIHDFQLWRHKCVADELGKLGKRVGHIDYLVFQVEQDIDGIKKSLCARLQ